MILKIVIALIPVFLLLVILLYLDSMKLVKANILMLCLAWGILSAFLSFFLNTFLLHHLEISIHAYSGYIAPVVEETFKLSILLLLIRKNRIGFMIDGAIYGFSIGAAFAFCENLFYLFTYASNEGNMLVWVTRGFGTAVMHSGTTAIFGILCMSAMNRRSNLVMAELTSGLVAIVIHGLYNRFLISPLISTIMMLILIPATILLIFRQNEKTIRTWLEVEFDSEVSLLQMIKKGRFSETRTGCFLLSVRNHFPGEVVFDMYCFISLYLELSLKAKSNMMLRENDLAAAPDPEIPDKLRELKSLRRSIGNAGYLAIAPVLRMSRKDLWKISMLNQENID